MGGGEQSADVKSDAHKSHMDSRELPASTQTAETDIEGPEGTDGWTAY